MLTFQSGTITHKQVLLDFSFERRGGRGLPSNTLRYALGISRRSFYCNEMIGKGDIARIWKLTSTLKWSVWWISECLVGEWLYWAKRRAKRCLADPRTTHNRMYLIAAITALEGSCIPLVGRVVCPLPYTLFADISVQQGGEIGGYAGSAGFKYKF